MEPTYHLEGIIRSKEDMEDFEGPLNLILMLLSKNKIEIRDIQISLILDQYLAHLDEMKAMDLEVASEFVQMASHLLYIKTKMLLSSQDDEVSELELLMSSLEQLKAKDVYAGVKEIIPALSKASEYGLLFHTKPPEPLRGNKEYRYRHECRELLKAFSDVISRGHSLDDNQAETLEKRRIVPRKIIYNVKEKSREIIEHLKKRGTVLLSEFYSESHSRSEVVATFISILELCSLGSVSLSLYDEEIAISFSGGETEEIIGSISE